MTRVELTSGTVLWSIVDDIEDEPQPKRPELPPEIWNTDPVDAERAMAAVRAMCA